MLEIFLIYKLCSAIGRILRKKGRDPGWYHLLAVVLWVGGEFTGAFVGGMLGLGAGAYLMALLGAATGAFIAYRLAQKAKSAVTLETELNEVFD